MKTQVITNKAKASSKVAVNINCGVRKKSKERVKKKVRKKVIIHRKQPIIKIPALHCPPIEERIKEKQLKVITEEICENFTLRCNSGAKVLWQALGVCPTVTIKVENQSACEMVLSVHRTTHADTVSQVILPDGIGIITADNLSKLEIECKGDSTHECCGRFTLFIHIPISMC